MSNVIQRIFMRHFFCIGILGPTLFTSSAGASDISNSVTITTSSPTLVSTYVYESQITINNPGTSPISGPLRLTLLSANQPDASLAFAEIDPRNGRQSFVVPLPNGTLSANNSVVYTLAWVNKGAPVLNPVFSVDGIILTPANSRTLVVSAFKPSITGTQGVAIGADYDVLVDGLRRGATDQNGAATVLIPLDAQVVRVEKVASGSGAANIPTSFAGSNTSINVLVGDGEVSVDASLRFYAAPATLLTANTGVLQGQAWDTSGAIVPISKIDYATLTDKIGVDRDVTSLVSANSSGNVVLASGIHAILAGLKSQAHLTVFAVSSDSRPVVATTDLMHTDTTVQIKLKAPPSNLSLPLANVLVTAKVANSNVSVTALTDSSGNAQFPSMPVGNISFQSKVLYNGQYYNGLGAATIDASHHLVTITLRALADVQTGVEAVSVTSADGTSTIQTIQPVARTQRKVNVKRLRRPSSVYPTPDGGAVLLVVQTGLQMSLVKDFGQITVTQGTPAIPLYASVGCADNDTWELSVFGPKGEVLYNNSSAETVNPLVFVDTAATIIDSLDVEALTANGPAVLSLYAAVKNVGNTSNQTAISAALGPGALQISKITANPPENPRLHSRLASKGDPNFSIPRPGARNVNQRSFDIEVQKDPSVTPTSVGVTLMSDGNEIGQALPDTTIGSDDVQIISQNPKQVKLRVRVTFKNRASNIASTPPPARNLGYHFTLKGTDVYGNEIVDEKDELGKRALWRKPDAILHFGTDEAGQGGDDWSAMGTYEWLSNYGSLVGRVNDIVDEHSLDYTGRHETHSYGTAIDFFNYYDYNLGYGDGAGGRNHEALAADVAMAFGTVGTTTPPANASAAKNRLVAWVSANRTGLKNLASNSAVQTIYTCKGMPWPTLPADWCESLLKAGTVTRTRNGVQESLVIASATTFSGKIKYRYDHNDHNHVSLNRTAIGDLP